MFNLFTMRWLYNEQWQSVLLCPTPVDYVVSLIFHKHKEISVAPFVPSLPPLQLLPLLPSPTATATTTAVVSSLEAVWFE